jgi:8-oxo-dGTP pyrophosphatase MutT (NUDIX family)
VRDRILKVVEPGVFWLQSLRNRVVKGVTLGVRGLVVGPAGDEVLLVRHSYVAGWYLPGGAVEPGETALASLVRELDEEAGIAPRGDAPLIGLYFNERHRRRDHVALYRVPDWHRIRPFVPNGEILESRFFSVTDLPVDATDATRRRLDEYFGKAPPSPYW